ncbi:MAG: hypothetical protein NDJ90_04250 [Oligoflexia bacterium]|nr:hypothetical protein [Oligoflexia bacterium]
MKTTRIALLLSSLLLPSALAFGSGWDLAEKTKLAPGLYQVNELESRWSTKYHLLVDDYVNEPGKSLAILFEADAVRQRRTIARLYQIRSIKNGSTLMFVPLAMDLSGNLRVTSEGQTNAPVIEVITRNGDHRYPYVLRGRNGALQGKLLGMRAANEDTPRLRPWPSSGIFASSTDGSVDVLVNGDEVSISSGSLADQTFNLIPLNGDEGKFAALTKSRLDTMGEAELADEKIQRLATFVDGALDRETLMIFTPTVNWGEFQLEAYQLTEPGLLEGLFPGKRNPN